MAWRRAVLALLILLPPAAMADPLTDAQARFAALHGYQVTLRSSDADGTQQVIRYAFRKPGWIRMDFERPHRGAVLIYSPDSRRVRLWPFGLGHWPELDLAPDHALLRNPKNHRADRSDVGQLLARLRTVAQHGSMHRLADTQLAGRPAAALEITGTAGMAGEELRRYRIWLARDTDFPLRVDSFGADGGLIESVDMSDARIDPDLPEHFFTP